MKSKMLDACLTVLGMAGVLVYVLSCAPSFSPDGEKVAFSVVDYDADRTSIIVYDIPKKKFETVAEFTNPNQESDDSDDIDVAYAAQWMPDGKRLLVNGSSLITMLPLQSGVVTRTLQPKEEMSFWTVTPPPVIGNYQFLRDNDNPVIYRVNLATWEVRSFLVDMDPNDFSWPISDGEKIYFAATLERDSREIGSIFTLNMENGTYDPVAQFDLKESGEFTGFVQALGEDRFAVASRFEDTAQIVLVHNKSIEKRIPVGSKSAPISIGNMVMARDKKRIYAAYTKKLDDTDTTQFGILEAPLDGQNLRETALFEVPGTDDEDGILLAFQIAIAPDGNKIAASALSFDADSGISDQDRVLYLADINKDRWKVDKIRLPQTVSSDGAEVQK